MNIPVTPRVKRLKERILNAPQRVYIERARLYTESYRETEGQPTIIRRAKALKKILSEMEIAIYDDELIVGNRSPEPRAGVVSPEMSISWLENEMDILSIRPQDQFEITDEDKRELREEIFPYWRGKTLNDLIKQRMPEDTWEAMQAGVFKINQMDKGMGHVLLDYESVLSKGFWGLKKEVEEKMQQLDPQMADYVDKANFYEAARISLDAGVEFAQRYARLAEEQARKCNDKLRAEELLKIVEICSNVPAKPAQNFYEAIQCIWFVYVIAQCESNASSISVGRLDQFLYPYFKADLKSGNLTLPEIQELVDCLWIKYNEIIAIRSSNSARYFGGFPITPNIVLGGVDERNRDASNELSLICLEATAHVGLPIPNVGIRIHSRTDERFLMKASEVISLGSGMPEVFNDEVLIPGFLNRGVTLEDARNYAVVGCVEVSIPGKAYGLTDISLFNLLKCLELTLNNGVSRLSGKKVGISGATISSYEDLENSLADQIRYFINHMVIGANTVDEAHADYAPVPFLSTMVSDCIENGYDVSHGGARYNFSGVQGVGIPNLADSLAVIKKLMFEDAVLSLEELNRILDSNYEGYEHLRQKFLNEVPKYGNDIDYVDDLAQQWLSFYCYEVEKKTNVRGGRFNPGSYTVSAHIPLGQAVGATPDGRRAMEPLADGGLSPAHGRDKNGPPAVLKSVGKLDHTLLTNGAILNLRFSPETLKGRSGHAKLAAFLRAFCDLKVLHVQFNVVSNETLQAAQKNPDDYRGLVVRVAGYSALFVQLNKEIQDDIIRRREHVL